MLDMRLANRSTRTINLLKITSLVANELNGKGS